MRSTASGEVTDDRTTRARIRDAAITTFAAEGVVGTTARKVAEAAGVSPGLVMHHFDSMEGLRTECDEYVVATIREVKQSAIAEGPNLDLLAVLRESDVGPLIGYLARVLIEDSPAVQRLVDELVADAEGYIAAGVAQGMVRPSENPQARAAVLVLWGLGALVLHRHVERILGVDLTTASGADPALAAYYAPVYEIFGGGFFTEAFAATALEAVAGLADPTPNEGTP
jgi:AcrR family transcriptional regulator